MLGWVGDIEDATRANMTFRTVLFTGAHSQLTVMRIMEGEAVGREVHPDHDQFLRIEKGRARVELGRTRADNDEVHELKEDWAVVVPAGVWHDVINVGEGDLKLYSIYSPAEHPPGTVHATRADAEAAGH